jgi:MoxR-like ATPase
MLMVRVTYPSRDEELAVMERMSLSSSAQPAKAMGLPDLHRARSVMSEIYMDRKVKEYIVDLVIATRRPEDHGAGNLKPYIRYGASPRASIYLNEAARAHAFLKRRGYVIPEDVKAIGLDVLRHRVLLSYEAEAENLTADQLLGRLFESVPVP